MRDGNRPGLFWPLVLMGLGALLLLQNFDLLPAGLWAALAQLWPVLFVIIGLDMLLGRRSSAGAALVVVVGVLVVAGALTYAALRASQLPPGEARLIAQTRGQADRLAVEIKFQAGELTLGALGESDFVMEGQVQNGAGETVEQRYIERQGVGQLSLEQRTQPLMLPFLAAREETARWEVRLDGDTPLSLVVFTGAGRSDLNLGDLALTDLKLTTGIGQTNVVFPASGAIEAEVATGVGDTTLEIPAGLPARITVSGGLTNVSVPARFGRGGNVYSTPGFEMTGDYLDLGVRAGVGRLTIR